MPARINAARAGTGRKTNRLTKSTRPRPAPSLKHSTRISTAIPRLRPALAQPCSRSSSHHAKQSTAATGEGEPRRFEDGMTVLHEPTRRRPAACPALCRTQGKFFAHTRCNFFSRRAFDPNQPARGPRRPQASLSTSGTRGLSPANVRSAHLSGKRNLSLNTSGAFGLAPGLELKLIRVRQGLRRSTADSRVSLSTDDG